MFDKIIKQAGREYQPRQRIIGLALAGPVFLLILPLALYLLGTQSDTWIGIPAFSYPPINALLGWLAILGGLAFAWWSIYVQVTLGRGTPVPLMATQKLIVRPPYSYCRNPMALGTFVMYGGEAVVLGSIGALFLVALGAGLLLIYIKTFEEKEMETRFGEEYRAYRRQTPFLFPRIRR